MGGKIVAMDEKIVAMDAKIETMDAKIDLVGSEMRQGFARVDDQLNLAKARDEELRGLVTFGLEARDVLRDEMRRRFDEASQAQEQQITLLQDAVRHLRSLK